MVTFRKSLPQDFVDLGKIKTAHLTRESPECGECLFSLPLDQSPISLTVEMESGEELAFWENLFIR
jgi:hypothetical protein